MCVRRRPLPPVLERAMCSIPIVIPFKHLCTGIVREPSIYTERNYSSAFAPLEETRRSMVGRRAEIPERLHGGGVVCEAALQQLARLV